MKIFKIIFKIIYYIFIAVVAGLAILLATSVLPIPGNIKFLSVLSGSMEPVIKTGSIVIVKPSADYQVNDIITFGSNTRTRVPITHRIVEIKQVNDRRTFITKGDANESSDSREVSSNEIIGRVLLAVPYLGYGVAAVRQPLGFVLIIIIPAAIIISDEIRKIIRELKKTTK